MRYMKLFVSLALMWSLSLLPAPTPAAQEQAAGARGGFDEGLALLNRAAAFLSQSPQFSVTIRAGFDVAQSSGQKIEFGEIRRIVLRRPDRFRSDIAHSDGEKGLVLFDGNNIIVFSEKDKVYARSPRPGDLDGAVIHLVSDLKMRLPLAMMFLSRLPFELEKRVRSVKIVEQSVAFDVPCVHLAVRTEEVDFQIWIPSEGEPLPRRIVITYKLDEGQPQFWANFSEWNLNPNPPESLFVFSPAEGVREIPFLAQMRTAEPGSMERPARKKGGKR